MKPNVLIDSYGWIEYFSDGPLAGKYVPYIQKADPKTHITPSIVLYEVYKKLKKESEEERALEAYGYILAYTRVVHLTEEIAIEAADVSLKENLAMADAIIRATAGKFNAKIVTGDLHFKGLKDVIYIGSS